MMRIFTLSFFQFLFLASISSQQSGLLKSEKITTYWNKEKKQVRSEGIYQNTGYSQIGSKSGKWIHYYKNGNIQEINNYYKGVLNGSYISYYLNGNLKIKTFYTAGGVDSTFEAYYLNGILAESGNYTISPKILNSDTSLLDYWITKTELINSVKIGDWKYFYENGSLMEKTHFIQNDSTEYIDLYIDPQGDTLISKGRGTRKSYFPSKKIKSVVAYENGIKNGAYKYFKPNGKERISGEFLKGEKSGDWMELFLTTDTIYQQVSYLKGAKNGVFKEYYKNGKISMAGSYENDFKNGFWTYSYINGSLDMKGTFKNDKQDGFWTFYYPKGIEYYKGNFINGQKSGEWKFFYNNSNLWKKGNYMHDLKDGYWITKFEDGDTAMAGKYIMDKENGLWKSWYENGQLKDIGYFNSGMMNSSWKGYYKSGHLKYSGEYDNDYKIGAWTFWSEKDEIIETKNFKLISNKSLLVPNENRLVKKSVPDGKWIKYSEYDQSVKSLENYENGDLNGVCSYYYPGGVIANRIVNYKAGKLNGVYQNFSRKGNLISETNYKLNKKHGDVKTYSKRGKLISHLVYKDGVKIKDEINKIYFNYSSPKQKTNLK